MFAKKSFRELINTTFFSGFTLVELLMVIALISIAMGVSSDILISIMRSYTKSSVINEIEQEANFVSLLIEHDLRNALAVSGNTEGTRIDISRSDGSTLIYEVLNGVLYRYPSTASASPSYSLVANPAVLSSNIIGGVTVECNPKCFDVSTTSPQTVDMHMYFRQASTSNNPAFSGSIPLETIVVIRNTY